MYKRIKNDEDFKRAVLDLYDDINLLVNTDCLDFALSVSDSAVSCIESITVYRASVLARSCSCKKKVGD